MAQRGILERLAAGPVLGDGGYLLELERRGWVRAGPFTPEVVLRRPEAVRELHTEFREAGSEVLQALTFYASRDKLATVGLQDSLPELNRTAVRIAREAASEQALVAGNLSLTWMYEPGDEVSKDVVRRTFDEQLELQVVEGIDFVIGETFSFLGEALLMVERAKRTGLPVMVTMTFENDIVTPEGISASDCAKALADAGADIVGVNCLRNPDDTLPLVRQMKKAVSCPVACQPAGFATPADKPDFTSVAEFPDNMETRVLGRKVMARFAARARDAGIGYIGACCGVAAADLREMARALGKKARDERPWSLDYERPMSAYEYHKHEG